VRALKSLDCPRCGARLPRHGMTTLPMPDPAPPRSSRATKAR